MAPVNTLADYPGLSRPPGQVLQQRRVAPRPARHAPSAPGSRPGNSLGLAGARPSDKRLAGWRALALWGEGVVKVPAGGDA